ncbi:MAG: hypothetical protein FH751_10895 [Firmicutes bacterium]|nr:hypothetical protein [Bacillota bacterium]
MKNLNFLKDKFLYVFLFVFFTVMFLAYCDPYENTFLALGILGFFMILKNISKYKKVDLLISFSILIIIFYLTSNLFLYNKSYKLDIASDVTRVKEGKAVLLVYRGESEKYNIKTEIYNIFNSNDIIKKIFTPFVLYNKKINYKRIGKSNYINNTLEVKNKLKYSLSDNYKVYLGYLYCESYIEEKIMEIANEGYKKIIVVPVFLTEGKEYILLKEKIESLKLFNVSIKYTSPVWNSEKIINSYIKKIWSDVSKRKIKDPGIILIGRGEKEQNKIQYINSVRQNLMFRKKIKEFLVQNLEFRDRKIKLSWFDYMKPGYITEIDTLFEYGVSDIFCVLTEPDVFNIENSKMSIKIKEKLDIPEGVRVQILNGFIEDENLIKELKNRIEFVDLQNWSN